jgi:hypothetical protein
MEAAVMRVSVFVKRTAIVLTAGLVMLGPTTTAAQIPPRQERVATLQAYRVPDADLTPADWKAILVGGSDLIDSYDNAARDLAARLRMSGVQRIATLLSMTPAAKGARPAVRRREVRRALGAPGSQDACLVFITSHANERGIYLSGDQDYLNPGELARIVDAACGARPAVLILSGCGTGTFIGPALTASNRIILAAAARGRVSYGATTSDRYVNFDRCLLQAIDAGGRTWRDVFTRTIPCVEARERWLGVTPSQPQAWFGAQVDQLPLPGRR